MKDEATEGLRVIRFVDPSGVWHVVPVMPDMVVRADGRVEWVCRHGVGHPIGHLQTWDAEWMGIHGCDGCCGKRPQKAAA